MGHTTQLRGMSGTLRMRTAISPEQWQPWTAVRRPCWASSAWHSQEEPYSSAWHSQEELCSLPGYAMLMRPNKAAEQLSMAATARVIWLCACLRYWPYRGVASSSPEPPIHLVSGKIVGPGNSDNRMS